MEKHLYHMYGVKLVTGDRHVLRSSEVFGSLSLVSTFDR